MGTIVNGKILSLSFFPPFLYIPPSLSLSLLQAYRKRTNFYKHFTIVERINFDDFENFLFNFNSSTIFTEDGFFFSINRYQSTKDAPCRIKGDRPCPPSKYRTPSGTCNNVRHPVWGARSAPFLKMLPPAYSDGE